MQVEVGAAARAAACLRAGLALLGLLLAPPALAQEAAPAPVAARASRVVDPAPSPLTAWDAGGDLPVRAERTRLAALQTGLGGFDAPARALLLDRPEGVSIARVRAAVRVAPELPLAQAALASALLREEHDVPGAAGAALQSLLALVRHPEAKLWLEATGLLAIRNALFFGALVFLAGLAARYAGAAAHDLGDRLWRPLPLFARSGVLGILFLLPALLGQGLAGIAFPLFGLALCYGSALERRAAWLAALLLYGGLELGSFGAARALAALDVDPVAAAFQRVEQGIPSDSDHARLVHAEGSDELAARGLALEARREGRLAEAAARYEELIAAEDTDATLVTNTANVWLALGDVERAVVLYELAAQRSSAPAVLYDLSYAYGQAIRPHAQDETLKRLQQADPTLAFDLTQVQEQLAGGFTLDLLLPAQALRMRAVAQGVVAAVTAELMQPLAPGALGADPVATFVALLVFAVVARAAAGAFRRSGACHGCGGQLCPRCDAATHSRDLCAACQRLFERPETVDPERRARRLAELGQRSRRLSRARLAACVLLPGAAGLLSQRPFLGLVGSVGFVAAVAACFGLLAGPADPLAAGAAGAIAFGIASAVCLGLFAVTVVLALRQPPEAAQ